MFNSERIDDLGLLNVVKASQIGLGEIIDVYTQKGRYLITGKVQAIFPRIGVQISSLNPDVGITSRELGALSVNTITKNTAIVDRFEKIYDPDLYVFVLPNSEEEVILPNDNIVEIGGVKAPEKPKDNEKAKSISSIKDTVKIKGSDVNVDNLPIEVKNKVMGLQEIDEEQMNSIISAISDSALSVMKRIGIKDTIIFPKIVEIQKAVTSVLGTK